MHHNYNMCTENWEIIFLMEMDSEKVWDPMQ